MSTARVVRSLYAERALLAAGWARAVRVDVDGDGAIVQVVTGEPPPPGVEHARGALVPGMPNLHSHAFQRAIAGLTERAEADGSFWTWRERMYRFVDTVTPERIGAIAHHLFVEMLVAGYTRVGEFHYLHHDRDGRPFADRAEMSRRVIEAAREAGIGITHLPSLYAVDGFDGRAPHDARRRFLHDADGFVALFESLRAGYRDDPLVRVGAAIHSLRAVPPPMMADALAGVGAIAPRAPVHIHVSEQLREVEECLAARGARPVEWLLANHAVDARWCLVHATHVDAAERAAVAAGGAVVGLCPTTEANLGDGVFDAIGYLGAGGAFGIGSDSHVAVDPFEELRWLEYGQRLLHRRRGLLASPPQRPSPGLALWCAAVEGGATALGAAVPAIAAGAPADLVVLDDRDPRFAAAGDDERLDVAVFTSPGPVVRDVMVAGRWRVRDGVHPGAESARRAFVAAVAPPA